MEIEINQHIDELAVLNWLRYNTLSCSLTSDVEVRRWKRLFYYAMMAVWILTVIVLALVFQDH